MAVHDLPFDCQKVFRPLLFDMDECPLPGTEREVLYPRQHEHIIFFVIHSEQLLRSVNSFEMFVCNGHLIVGKGAGSTFAELLYLYQIEQLVGRGIA